MVLVVYSGWVYYSFNIRNLWNVIKGREMFEIKKTFTISASHQLNLPYESKCKDRHGHNFRITIYCRSSELDENGMVIDFVEIKKKIENKLDHTVLNDVLGLGTDMVKNSPAADCPEVEIVQLNPTAERIAEWICMQIDKCYRVEVEEVEGNVATYYW